MACSPSKAAMVQLWVEAATPNPGPRASPKTTIATSNPSQMLTPGTNTWDDFDEFCAAARSGGVSPAHSSSRSQTPDQLHINGDSETYCKSAPHSRHGSQRLRRQTHEECEEEPLFRGRTHSVPNRTDADDRNFLNPEQIAADLNDTEPEPDVMVQRNFITTSKGFRNRGDSFRHKSGKTYKDIDALEQDIDDKPQPSPQKVVQPSHDAPRFHILTTGIPRCGKKILVEQLRSTDSQGIFDIDDEEFREKVTIPVTIDGKESVLVFHLCDDIDTWEEIQEEQQMDAHLLVYSITDRESFDFVSTLLSHVFKSLKSEESFPVVMMVGNKKDLERQREVRQEDSEKLAKDYAIRNIETSAMLAHNCDLLLVDLVAVLRNPHKPKLSRKVSRRRAGEPAPAKEGDKIAAKESKKPTRSLLKFLTCSSDGTK